MPAPGAQGRLLQAALQVVRGAFMGAADVVPGVSGGTVALLLGIYDRLIGAVDTGARALDAWSAATCGARPAGRQRFRGDSCCPF